MSDTNFLAQRRKELGLSQSKIAGALGYSVQTISKWEIGKSFPDLPVWGELAKVLQIDLDALINDKIKNNYNNVCFDNIFSAEKFSSNLRRQRKIRDETQKQLADKLGISYQTLLAWEKGTTFPNVEQFKLLSKELNISYDDLYFSSNVLTTSNIEDKSKLNSSNEIEKCDKKTKLFLRIALLFASVIAFMVSTILISSKFNDSVASLDNSSNVKKYDEKVKYPFNEHCNRGVQDRDLAIIFVFREGPTEILASTSGTVSVVKTDNLFGNTIWIRHESGIKSIYSSLSEINVQEGQEIKQGDVIGKSGTSLATQTLGSDTLHFRMIKKATQINANGIFGKSLDEI
ncbi:MAG: helix-turn-helix domain-containing protein [Erysipelotrichales bacterium]|nr:helix-turn-helix domain-containing protein [Erysipelotrichales bacterium]